MKKYSSENKYVDEEFNLEQAKIIKELKEEMAELKKENEFLKKAAAFFAKEKKLINRI